MAKLLVNADKRLELMEDFEREQKIKNAKNEALFLEMYKKFVELNDQ